MIGTPEWNIYVAERGGEALLFEIPYSAFYHGRRINDTSNATVEISGNCCDIIPEIVPASHELVAFRAGQQVWAGPITDMRYSADDASISARDVSQWFNWRVISQDRGFSDDLAYIFRELAQDALAIDPSPNIQVLVQAVGVVGERIYFQGNYEVVGDKLRELTRTGLDYTTRGRTVLAGRLETMVPGFRLTDADVRTATATVDALGFATEIYVLGSEQPATDNATQDVSNEPVNPVAAPSRTVGYAEQGSEKYGRIQRSFVENDIRDRLSLEENARARLAAVQPSPISLNVTLDPQASLEYDELIPGCRVDTRLAEVAGCAIPIQDMRLTSISTGVVAANEGVTEYTNFTLVPMEADPEEAEEAEGEE